MEKIKISKKIFLEKLNDPMYKDNMTDIGEEFCIDLHIVYTLRNLFRVVKKNGIYISLDK